MRCGSIWLSLRWRRCHPVWCGPAWAATSSRASGPIGRALRLIGNPSYGIYRIHIMGIELAGHVIVWVGPPGSYWLACLMLLVGSLSLGYIDTWLQPGLKGAVSRAFACSPRGGPVAMPGQVA